VNFRAISVIRGFKNRELRELTRMDVSVLCTSCLLAFVCFLQILRGAAAWFIIMFTIQGSSASP
jgi:hypothetical protein